LWLFSVRAPNDQLQSRPGFINRAHLYIDEPKRQRNGPNYVFSHISRYSGRFFRPRNPDRARIRKFHSQLAQLFFQFTPAGREKMNETRISSRPIGKLHAIRDFAEQLPVICRFVDDYDGHRRLYSKFLRQWCARITGHSERI
jgi:hypothetical protein